MMTFPQDVQERLNVYVYRLIDPRSGSTFYVGKGINNRVFGHLNCNIGQDEDFVSAKQSVIQSIRNSGLEPIVVIHRHGMDDETAKEVEAALIDAYQQLTNIQAGVGSNDFGPRTVYEILREYSSKEIEIAEGHKLLFITIGNGGENDGIGLYDRVRLAWRVNFERARRATHVLAIRNGIVMEVYSNLCWAPATSANFPILNNDIPGRFGFSGEVAPIPDRELYLNRRIPSDYRLRGASNPIRYSYD